MAAADILARLSSDSLAARDHRARTFVRRLICQALGDTIAKQGAIAAARWGREMADSITKAAVSAVTTTDTTPEAQAFFSLVHERSLLGRIAGLRRVPFDVRMISPTAGAQGYWVSEGASVPLSRTVIAGSTLKPLRVSAIFASTKEAVERGGLIAEQLLQDDILGALVGPLDAAFTDPTNGGVAGEIPASVAYGQPQVLSAGNDADSVLTDLRALFAVYAGDLTMTTLVMNPKTALQISLMQKPLGQSALGVAGGMLFGLPVVTSRSVPIDSTGGSILLIDGSAIGFDFDGGSIWQAQHATLEMSDAPIGSSTTPTAATSLVSLWQTGSIAWCSDLRAAWQVHGTGRVVTLTGVDYSGGVSP